MLLGTFVLVGLGIVYARERDEMSPRVLTIHDSNPLYIILGSRRIVVQKETLGVEPFLG